MDLEHGSEFEAEVSAGIEPATGGLWRDAFKELRRKKSAVAGACDAAHPAAGCRLRACSRSVRPQ